MNALRLLVALAALGAIGAAHAQQAQRPLTLADKQSLYQRVLAVPGAALRPAPETTAGEPLVPFTVLYVYERRAIDGQQWLQVGADSHGGADGWMPDGEALDWHQNLTVAFREPQTHKRVLLFRDRASLAQLLEEHDVIAYRQLRRAAEQGLAADSPVVAIQPQAHVDIHEDFYLVPILHHEDVFVGDRQGLLMKVATVPLPREERPADGVFRSGIVFVVDATVSMGPYIDRAREVIRQVYRSIDTAGLTGQVSFGLIAFRDSTDAVPGLEYRTRVYATLADGLDAQALFAKVEEVSPAQISSRDFREDAFSGVKRAIEDLDWRGYDARYVILITDAGPRTVGDPLGATGLDAQSLRRLARDKGIALWTLHLLTPQGREDHERAEAEYRALSSYEGIGEFYYPVDTGDVERFGRALGAMTTQLAEQVRETAQGVPPLPVAGPPAAHESELEQFQRKVARLGYALRLRYLQEREGGAIPTLFEAWLVDRDFEDPERPAVEVRVLLSRDQLSDLQQVLRQVLETAELGALSPESFLDDLRSLAASISRDPQAVGRATRTMAGPASLADLGYMREYIEGLPYRSEVMELDLASWEQWSAKRQFEFINALESKIGYYQALHDNVDLWIALDGGPIDGDAVYPMLLEALP